MSDESRPNYRMLYDGQISAPVPVVGTHDFYADNHKDARRKAIRTIMDWNYENPSFGLAGLLALNENGHPADEKVNLLDRK